jgi:hypothetical protein
MFSREIFQLQKDCSPLPRLPAGRECGITGATAGANHLLRSSCGTGALVTIGSLVH